MNKYTRLIIEFVVIGIIVFLIAKLVFSWVENKDPIAEIDSIAPLTWNSLITVTGSVYDGLAIPSALGGSGIALAKVYALDDKNRNDVSDAGEGGFVQIGSNITQELLNATLVTWSTQKMGSRYRIWLYAEDGAANTANAYLNIDTTTSIMGTTSAVIGTMH